MNTIVLSPAKLGFIVVTRAALAFGVGLLISRRLDDTKRRTVGTTFVGLGALTTVPALLILQRGRR